MSGAAADGAPTPEGDRPTGPQDILVSEVFSAIQGEAALVGERQVFVRLTGCNIRCAYCDQPEALERVAGPCRVERTAGRRDWSVEASPLGLDRVVEAVGSLWDQVPHHSISLTGGEPLLQGTRVEGLVDRLAAQGWPVMLETNGTLLPPLRRIGSQVAYVSMDVKLRSVDGEMVAATTQSRFLAESLASGATTWVKIVLGPDTDVDEFDAAIAMVAAASAGRDAPVEVFLQPVTPFAAVLRAPTPDQVLELH